MASLPTGRPRPGAPRHAAWSHACRRACRLWVWPAAAALLLRPEVAGAAASAPPGVPSGLPSGPVPEGPDPAQADGDAGGGVGAADRSVRLGAANPPAAGDVGVRWALAPVRLGGSVSLDLRAVRLEDGRRATQQLLYGEVQGATHVWEPWFIQLRGGVGALLGHDATRESPSASAGGSPSVSRSDTRALTGHLAASVFPFSRFPFEARAELSDSRARGDQLGSDYRLLRLGASQAWRDVAGRDSLDLHVDHSRLQTLDGVVDRVSTVHGSALRQLDSQNWELSGQLSRNDRSDSDDATRIASLAARHTYSPLGELHVDTLASWNELRLRSGVATARFDSETALKQVSTFATWRPGGAQQDPDRALYLTGSARLLDSDTDTLVVTSRSSQRLQAVNASVGANQALGRDWRLAGTVSATELSTEADTGVGGSTGATTTAQRSRLLNTSAGLTWSPAGVPLGDWRYTPSLSGTLGHSRSSESGNRYSQGAQLSHAVSRDWLASDSDSLSLSLSQSLGVLHESASSGGAQAAGSTPGVAIGATTSQAIAHAVGLYWQGLDGGASQSYASLSASDSRTRSPERGHFQLLNLQLSRRTELSRHASWSGNLTLQSSRSDVDQLDPFTGLLRQGGPGWQRFYSGSLAYEQQRLWGVPRLRHTVLLTVSSQQLDSRATGDIEALHERVSESIEDRIDYSIGRLELRLSARAARIEGRSVALLAARALRRF